MESTDAIEDAINQEGSEYSQGMRYPMSHANQQKQIATTDVAGGGSTDGCPHLP